MWHESVIPRCRFLRNRLTGQSQSGPSKPAKAQTSPSSPTIQKMLYTDNSTTRTGRSTALRIPTPYTCRLPPTALLPVSATLHPAEDLNKGTNTKIADYGNVYINSGYTTPGFSEADEDGLLVWNNTDMANGGSYFALCPRVIPGYENKGVQAQVFWQSNEAPSEGTKDCKPIVIHGAWE